MGGQNAVTGRQLNPSSQWHPRTFSDLLKNVDIDTIFAIIRPASALESFTYDSRGPDGITGTRVFPPVGGVPPSNMLTLLRLDTLILTLAWDDNAYILDYLTLPALTKFAINTLEVNTLGVIQKFAARSGFALRDVAFLGNGSCSSIEQCLKSLHSGGAIAATGLQSLIVRTFMFEGRLPPFVGWLGASQIQLRQLEIQLPIWPTEEQPFGFADYASFGRAMAEMIVARRGREGDLGLQLEEVRIVCRVRHNAYVPADVEACRQTMSATLGVAMENGFRFVFTILDVRESWPMADVA
ncbi:hypothetical protein MKEN_00401900 [Mycena kentingensis (nom. inval.)]|nr:hypothetical protein MKEN_00401900 [Mycena kentingensis (nom. inval.)]